MASERKYLVDINLNGNQIKNVAAENLPTHPTNPVLGQFYYNTSLDAKLGKKFHYFAGYDAESNPVWIAGAEYNASSSTAPDVVHVYKSKNVQNVFQFAALKGIVNDSTQSHSGTGIILTEGSNNTINISTNIMDRVDTLLSLKLDKSTTINGRPYDSANGTYTLTAKHIQLGIDTTTYTGTQDIQDVLSGIDARVDQNTKESVVNIVPGWGVNVVVTPETRTNPIVSGKIDSSTELDSNSPSAQPFLSVGANGFKIDGIKNEIDRKINKTADANKNYSGDGSIATSGTLNNNLSVNAYPSSKNRIARIERDIDDSSIPHGVYVVDDEYVIKKLGGDPTYAAQYQLFKIVKNINPNVDDVEVAVGDKISIIKDQFIKDVVFIASATEDDKVIEPTVVVGDPYLKITWELNEPANPNAFKVTYVAMKSLMDVYVGKTNEISIDVDKVVSIAAAFKNALNSEFAKLKHTSSVIQRAVTILDEGNMKTDEYEYGRAKVYTTQCTANNNVTIAQTVHKCGPNPMVQTFLNGEDALTRISVDAVGNVTISWNGSGLVTNDNPLNIVIIGHAKPTSVFNDTPAIPIPPPAIV